MFEYENEEGEVMDFTQLSANLERDPIVGYLPDGRYINLPLVSHVVDNLYVGGCEPADLGDFFSHVFSLYVWGRGFYKFGENTKLTEWIMLDSPRGINVMDVNENPVTIEEVADEIVDALNEGGNVLVHCQAGINRSNLTAALALRKWKGLSSREAIDLLREKRGELILANKTFESYLLGLDRVDA